MSDATVEWSDQRFAGFANPHPAVKINTMLIGQPELDAAIKTANLTDSVQVRYHVDGVKLSFRVHLKDAQTLAVFSDALNNGLRRAHESTEKGKQESKANGTSSFVPVTLKLPDPPTAGRHP